MVNNNDGRIDYRIISELIRLDSTVLDLGCGAGELLSILIKEKNVTGCGIELDEQAIYKCVEKGLSVFHGDIDSGIAEYNDKSFDYVILNQTLQQVRHLENTLLEALRVGENVIVGLPNFAYINSRFQMFFSGKAPVTPALPFQWYSTPNLHFCSISDFLQYCHTNSITVKQAVYIDGRRTISILPNLFAESGIFLIKKELKL